MKKYVFQEFKLNGLATQNTRSDSVPQKEQTPGESATNQV